MRKRLLLTTYKKEGFDIEGLDIGKKILEEIRKKDKTIQLYQKDMSNYNTKKKYDAILCLNSSLVLLPNFTLIKKTIEKTYEHLTKNGLFILDVANHKVEIKESNQGQTIKEYLLKNGVMHVIYKDYKKGNKWIAEQRCFINENGQYKEFKETFAELIFNPQKLEETLQKTGFTITKMYGTRDGKTFNKKTSWRRIYICTKN